MQVRVFEILLAYSGPNFEQQDTSRELMSQRHVINLE